MLLLIVKIAPLATVKFPKITLLTPLPVFIVVFVSTVSLFAKNPPSPVSLIGKADSNSSLSNLYNNELASVMWTSPSTLSTSTWTRVPAHVTN